MPQPTVFRARFLAECPVCQSTIEPGEAVAYDDERLVHAVHHSNPRVRVARPRRKPAVRRGRR